MRKDCNDFQKYLEDNYCLIEEDKEIYFPIFETSSVRVF